VDGFVMQASEKPAQKRTLDSLEDALFDAHPLSDKRRRSQPPPSNPRSAKSDLPT
jgi:hypothetical protein